MEIGRLAVHEWGTNTRIKDRLIRALVRNSWTACYGPLSRSLVGNHQMIFIALFRRACYNAPLVWPDGLNAVGFLLVQLEWAVSIQPALPQVTGRGHFQPRWAIGSTVSRRKRA